MTAYYNENDPQVVAWLRELIRAGEIEDGEVDARSIADVSAADVRGFDRCHFFAGIGGWAYALRLADWPNDRPLWSGSCPCQPFSGAGKKDGADDTRHLWPSWFRIVSECRPAIVVGEQVASADGLGWVDLVSTDLEAADYAVGTVDLCAAGVGAPHIRQRLYWLGIASGARLEGLARDGDDGDQSRRVDATTGRPIAASGAFSDLADASGDQRRQVGTDASGRREGSGAQGVDERLMYGGVGFWSAVDWVACRDGKYRPVEPGSFPLAHGVPARVGRLRGYGNAIVPQVAAAFLRAVMDVVNER